MISYEVSIGLILISILGSVGSLNFIEIVAFQNYIYFFIPFFPLFLMFLISILAETNRAPFDLPEAESELVSGFNVEYASMGFALFFLAEYGSIILMSLMTVLLFLGGWLSFSNSLFFINSLILGLKTSLILFFFHLSSSFISTLPCRPIDAIMLKNILTTFFCFCCFYIYFTFLL
jgi:NADH-quinone oxidoreductase subunit H